METTGRYVQCVECGKAVFVDGHRVPFLCAKCSEAREIDEG